MNIDEETANLTELQQLYSASAQLLEVLNEMFDALIDRRPIGLTENLMSMRVATFATTDRMLNASMRVQARMTEMQFRKPPASSRPAMAISAHRAAG